MKRDDISAKLGALSAWDDDATGVVKVLLRGESFNVNGISTLSDKNGNRLTDLEFDYLVNSACGLFRVHVPDGKYGYVDPCGKFAIEPIYDWAMDFSEDLAWVVRDGELLILRKDGAEIKPDRLPVGDYARVESFHQGLARVSIVDMGGFWGFMSLAFHHDDADNAGIWGYVNAEGRVVVEPKYIFAEDFSGGIAIVCEGQWTKDERWDNECNQGRWWSEKMLWGAIDREGRTVIPCKLEEIMWRPWSKDWPEVEMTKKYLAVRDVNGKCGLIDFRGNWVVGPQFGDMRYSFETSPDGDMFVFHRREIWGGGDPDRVPCGIYSLSKHRVILPADRYVEIDFVDNEHVKVCESPCGEAKIVSLSSLPETDPGVTYEEWSEEVPEK